MSNNMINVINGNKVIARVKYNDNLDFWYGNNRTCGVMGRHKGLTVLKNAKEYVLIHGTQFQGERDWAEIITPEDAFQEIIQSGNTELFDDPMFAELKKYIKELDTD